MEHTWHLKHFKCQAWSLIKTESETCERSSFLQPVQCVYCARYMLGSFVRIMLERKLARKIWRLFLNESANFFARVIHAENLHFAYKKQVVYTLPIYPAPNKLQQALFYQKKCPVGL